MNTLLQGLVSASETPFLAIDTALQKMFIQNPIAEFYLWRNATNLHHNTIKINAKKTTTLIKF